MDTHKYAHVLRWIADEESVQVNIAGWTTCSLEGVLRHILNGSNLQFRLEPKTVRVGDRQIEAPLQSAAHGSEAYACSAAGGINHITFNTSNDEHVHALANGRLFATPEAAKSAYDAITALLTGKDAA